MKRIITLFFIIFYIAYSFCQTYIYFGTGCNFSQFPASGYHENTFDSKLSYLLISGIKTNIIDNFNCLIELAYNNYSTSLEGYEGSPSHSYHYNFDLKLGYFSLFLLPGYSTGNKKLIFLNVGPYISMLAFSKKNGTMEGYYDSPKGRIYTDSQLTGNASDYFRILDFGLLASLGIRFKINANLFLSPQFKYAFGLLNIGNGHFAEPINIRSPLLVVALDYKLKQN